MVKQTPPMGWNSWNTFGEEINEAVILENCDALIDSGLAAAGYEYIIIDDCWSLKERDENGCLVPDPVKFPHGMKYVADYIHSKGLKFGMYSCAGNWTCGGYPGSYEHEFIDAKTFASWDVDYLKYDYCNHTPEVLTGGILFRRMGLALENTGRDILFAACTGGIEQTHDWIKTTAASSWRSTGDIVDTWESMKWVTSLQKDEHVFGGQGCFNDMDMLIVGMYGEGNVGITGCSDIQYRTHFSIWALLGSPLIIGCDLRKLTPASIETLGKKELIAINQDPICRQPLPIQPIMPAGEAIGYARFLSTGEIAIGLFNLGDEKVTFRFNLDALSLSESTGMSLAMTDIWSGKDAEIRCGTVSFTLDPHDCAVFRAKVIEKPYIYKQP